MLPPGCILIPGTFKCNLLIACTAAEECVGIVIVVAALGFNFGRKSANCKALSIYIKIATLISYWGAPFDTHKLWLLHYASFSRLPVSLHT
jgi:hypothetical protein